LVLDGPQPAGGADWYQIEVASRGTGWVSGQYIARLNAGEVVNGSIGEEEAVHSTNSLALEPSPTPEAPTEEPPAEVPTDVPTLEPTQESTLEPTQEPSATPTPTPTLEPTLEPTLPPDSDGDGVPDELDTCPGVINSGFDSDGDTLDDACDPTPLGEPTVPPVVERSFSVAAGADTSVSSFDPAAVQPGDQIGGLPVGGQGGNVAFITFWPDQVGAGTVTSAILYLPGQSGAGSVNVAVAPGVAIDEWSLTYGSAPGGSAAGGVWIDAGVEAAVDLTGWIAAGGPITIIVSGDGVTLGSREGGWPAYLVITVLDG
jgi:hypothetical protein